MTSSGAEKQDIYGTQLRQYQQTQIRLLHSAHVKLTQAKWSKSCEKFVWQKEPTETSESYR